MEFFDRMVPSRAALARQGRHAIAFGDRTIASFHYSLLQSPVGRDPAACCACAGSTELGYLYLFVWKRVAYFYQSGIKLRRYRPGEIAGVRHDRDSMEHMLQTDVERFEFLAETISINPVSRPAVASCTLWRSSDPRHATRC